MIPYMTVQALSEGEIDKIHSAMVSILAHTGLAVEHGSLREAYAAYGARVDNGVQRVWFPKDVVERFLNETVPVDWLTDQPNADPFDSRDCYRPLCPGDSKPSLSVRSGVTFSYYLEPGTRRPVPFTQDTLADYIKLARLLDNDIRIRMETMPVGKGRPTQPLEGRLFAWKHGAREQGGIQMTELCPYLLEMVQIKADALNKPVPEIFCGSVYIISPLRLPRDIGDQILFFQSRGLKVRIGNMITMGGTGPVTLAGCLALNLAERIAIGILERVLYGDKQWTIYGEVVPLNMMNLAMLSARPEILLLSLAVIQLARYYRVPAHPYGGYTDARLPSVEAGMQKVMTALPCILAGGCNIDAGKLSGSTCSPIQMILDSELIGALRRTLRGFDVNDATLAVDLINEVGPGGTFTATQHTVRHMRTEFWQPNVWSVGTLQAQAEDIKTDVERAFDRWHDLMSQPDPEPGISEDTERRIQMVIDRAAQNL